MPVPVGVLLALPLAAHATGPLASVAGAGSQMSGVGCEQSPILFSFSGALFASYEGQQPQRVASRLGSPQNLKWAPGCRRYAFIESGSLWVGSIAGQTARAEIAGWVYSFYWRPDGGALAVEAERTACGEALPASPGTRRADTFLAGIPGLSVRPLSQDCRTFPLGWSNDGTRVLVARQVTYPLPCVPWEGGCAAADILACHAGSGECKVLITQRQLALERKDVSGLVHWDAKRRVLYVRSWDLNFGGTGRLLALDESTGKTLWSQDAEAAEYLGGGIFGVQHKVVENPDEGFVWKPVTVNKEGGVVEKFPLLCCPFGWSPHRLWMDSTLDARKGERTSSVSFSTRNKADAWQFRLPSGYRPCSNEVWTPRDTDAVIGYEDAVHHGRFALKLWEVNPTKERARLLMQGDAAIDPRQPYPGIRACTDGTGPDSSAPPLAVAAWDP